LLRSSFDPIALLALLCLRCQLCFATIPNIAMADVEELEQAFAAIRQGKVDEFRGHFWEAAASFERARHLLKQLASQVPSDTADEELCKIYRLYQEQSYEYMHHARLALMEGLKEEMQTDLVAKAAGVIGDGQDSTTHRYACQNLSDEDVKKRVKLFSSLFAQEVTIESALVAIADGTQHEIVDSISTQQPSIQSQEASLEERLRQLNANLPKNLKSSDERLQDINHGMAKLGISLPVAPLTFKPRKSASQEVEDIIAQAQDEVAMEQALSGGKDTVSTQDSVISDNDDDADDGSLLSNADSLLPDEVPVLQNVSVIQEEIAAAHAKLAELLAMLDDLPKEAKQEKGDNQDGQPANSTRLDPFYGKKMLQDAKQSVRKALRLWRVKAACCSSD
jgi:hypothetical protein